MKRAVAVAGVLTLLSCAAAAEPFGMMSNLAIVGGDGAVALRWKRCTATRYAPEDRISACKRLISDNATGAYRARRALAAAHEEQRDVDAVLSDYAAMIADGDTFGLLLRADLLAATGQYDKAMDDLKTYTAQNRDEAENLNDRCWMRALARQELEAGLADCEAALKLKPDDADTLDSRAFVLFRLGRMADAIASYNAALKQDERLASSLYMRGVIESKNGDKASGAADITAAKEIDPKIALTYERYGVAGP
jgi:tetratricopeptide (TPR) repeat protein